jgi:autotransporter-associated beta strand protein
MNKKPDRIEALLKSAQNKAGFPSEHMGSKLPLRALLLACGCLTVVHSSRAANLYWDGGSVDIAAVGNTASAGGAGTWNTAILNWDAGPGAHVAWNNAANDTAIFAGTAAAVTVAVPITVGGVTLSSNGYVFSGSTVEIASGGIFTGPANGSHNFSGFALAPGNTVYRFQSSSVAANFANSAIFNMTTGLTGAGNSVVISGTQAVYLTSTTAPTYGGTTTVGPGAALGFDTVSIAGIGGGTGVRSISMDANSTLMFRGGNLNNTVLGQVVATSNVFTIIANNGGVANNLDFTNYPNASLGFWDNAGTRTFSLNATVTPANDIYRFGSPRAGNNINLILANALTGNRSVIVNGGDLRLAAVMDFTGPVTINAGTFTIGSPVAAFPTAGNGLIGGGVYSANILNNGTLAHTSSLDQSLTGIISGTGGVTKSFTTSTGGNAGTWGTNSTLTLSDANTFTGVTNVNAGILAVSKLANGGLPSGIGQSANAGTNLLFGSGGTLRYTGAGDSTDRQFRFNGSVATGFVATIEASGTGPILFTSTTGPTNSNAAQPRTLVLGGSNSGDNTLAAPLADNTTGALALVKSGVGTWVISGANSYTGSTTVSSGKLKLDHTVDSSRLSDTGILTLSGGTLDLAAGNHLEAVGSTTLGAGSASIVSRSGGTAKLAMNVITPGASAVVNFSTGGIATTDNANTNGILGTWATVGGTDWAANSTGLADGDIVAYIGYTDIDAQGSIIADGASSNVRIVGDGAGGPIQLGAAITTVNTLLQNNSTIDATIDTVGGTFGAGAIWISAGKAALTVGALANDGLLTPSTAGGNLALINDNTSKNLTVNAVVADNTSASTLSTAGPGTVILNGNNTHSGGTTLGGGTLVLGNAAALGTGSFTIAGGTVASTGTVVAANGINANGDFSIAGTGTLTLSGAMTLNSNRVITNNNTTGTTSFFDIGGSGRNLTFSGDGNTTVTGFITTGTGGLTKNGTGTLTLTETSTYTGATVINGGTLQIGNGGNTGAVSATTIVTNNAALVFNLNDTPNPEATVANAIRGTGTLTKQGSGRLTLTGNSTYTGATTLSAGILQIGNGGTTGSIASTSSLANGTGLVYNRSNALTVAHPISGAGTLTQIGSGTLTLAGTNTYTGDTILSAGILSAGVTENLGDPAADLVFNGGALQVTGTALSNFSGIGHTVVFNADTTVRLDINSALHTFTIDQTLNQGLGGFTKLGAGTAIINLASTYTGTTTVTAGTLLVNSPGSLAAGSLVFVDGGTLGGNGTIGDDVTVAAPANLAPGASAGTLAIGGDLDLTLKATGTGKLIFELDALAATNDRITVAGNLLIGSGVLGLNDFTFIDLGGLQVGTYKLITSGGINVADSLDAANVTGSITSTFNGTLQINGNDLELVVTLKPPYEQWIAGFSVGALTGKNDDPDSDGLPNFLEFAFNSSPANGGSRGKIFARMATVGGTPGVLTLTIAARSGASFAALGNDQQAVVAADSLTYLIEASNDLADWGTPVVSEVTGGDASAIQATLTPPSPDSGWTYHTFRTDDDAAGDARDFIRAEVTTP